MRRTKGFTLIEVLMVVTIVAVVAAMAIPSIVSARKSANEGSAVGSLRQIASAQALFREGDRERDGNIDYGMLSELTTTQLLDGVLGAGTKAGYRFQATYGYSSSEFLWFAIATPVIPAQTGDRYFAVNHGGGIFYTSASITLDTDTCLLPNNGVIPVGK